MKIYDKEIYNREQNMKSIILMIIIFLIGFFTGYIANNNKVNNINKSENEINKGYIQNSNQ